MSQKELVVSAIENGTVIDHIPADNLFKVVELLGLKNIDTQVTIGTNLSSSKLGKKGIIKVADKFFDPKECSKVALLAPEAKINIIRNYEVAEKLELTLPDEVRGFLKCMNPKCVTNHQPIETRFRVSNPKQLALKCHYCEKVTTTLLFK